MLALLDLFCHDVRRHSPILVRPQNPKEIEFSAIKVWLWRLFDGTVLRPFLPTSWWPQLLHHVFFCEAVVCRMCCNLSSLSIPGSSFGRTLFCRISLSMTVACNRQRHGALCNCSQLACYCMRNKEKADPFIIPERQWISFYGINADPLLKACWLNLQRAEVTLVSLSLNLRFKLQVAKLKPEASR